MSEAKYTIALVDDHPIVLEGLVKMLEAEERLSLCGSFASGQALLSFLGAHNPDIVLLDIALPDTDGMELCRIIKSNSSQTIVLAFSNRNERSTVLNMLHHGASGFLLKSASPGEIIAGIYDALDGKLVFSEEVQRIIAAADPAASRQAVRLTAREKEVLQMIASGTTTPQIAKILFLSKFTVENHRKNILQKLQVKNVAELIAEAARQGLLE